jgi:hypothetical protein
MILDRDRELILACVVSRKIGAMKNAAEQSIEFDDAERVRELSALLPLWPKDLLDTTLAGRRRVAAAMERALRAERRRGRAGHWAYDLARHAALLRAWKRERDEIAAEESRRRVCGGKPLR